MSGEAVGVKATFSVHGQVVHELEPSARQTSAPQPVGVGQQVFVVDLDMWAHNSDSP